MAQASLVQTPIKVQTLNSSNFVEWKIKVTSLLKSRDLFKFCEKNEDLATVEEEDYELFNEAAKSLIYSFIDGRTTQAVGVCEHAYQLWDKVLAYYEGSKEDNTGLALAKFMELRIKDDEPIVDFLGRYDICQSNLAMAGLTVDISILIYVLTRSLPQAAKEGIKIWKSITSESKQTISALISYLRANYRDEEQPKTGATALYGNAGNKWKRKKFPGPNKGYKPDSKPNKDQVTCTYCKKNGHRWQDCFKLQARNKNKNDKRDNSRERAHMAMEASYHMYQEYFPKSSNTWVIDSGATAHMVRDSSILMNYEYFATPREIMLGDGEHIQAFGKGWIFFAGSENPLALKEVLHVPRIATNLFSVKMAIKDGFEINFSNSSVTVKHGKDKIPVLFDGYLYILALKILHNRPQQALTAYRLDTWHKKLAHINMDAIKRLKSLNIVDGLQFGPDPISCEDCLQGKSCRKPHPSRLSHQASRNHAIIHFDTVDMTIEALGGKKYFVLGTEEYSGYKIINFAKKKSEISDIVKLTINSVVLNSRRPVLGIYSDNGTEFVNKDLGEWLSERGIIHELSSAYNAEQNGRAEASNKAVINAARTMLLASSLPKFLWTEACATAVYVQNRLPNVEAPTKSRYELYFGKRPNLSNLHEFGEVAIRLTPRPMRGCKVEPLAEKFRFVGYTNRFNTFRLYDEVNRKIIIDCNVRFTNRQPRNRNHCANDDPLDELSFGWENYLPNTNPIKRTNNTSSHHPGPDAVPIPTNQEISHTNESINDAIHNQILEQTQSRRNTLDQSIGPNNDTSGQDRYMRRSSIPRLIDLSSTRTTSYNQPNIVQTTRGEQPMNQPANVTTRGTDRITRSQTGTLRPIYDPASLLPPSNPRHRGNIALFSLYNEPQTLQEAKSSPDWDKWQQAMTEEIQSLEENRTWTIVDKPSNVKPIKAKWIFKLKLNTDGTIDRYKARLVAKGYSQIPDIDYKQTFAPVASMTTVRLILAAAVQYNYEIIQFDIRTAFLYGDLEEELYMEIPDEYKAPPGKVCKLQRSLYGLKQAPRQWHKKFDSFLKEFQLQQSEYDKCLYYSEDRQIILTIYVDDGLIIARHKELAIKLIDYLKEHLTVKTMDCNSYLGLEIIRNRDKNTLAITQRQYVQRTLEKFGMETCNPTSTPEETGQVNFKDSSPLDNKYPFKELVGSLLYLVTCTRPDIAHAVSVASRTSEPTDKHWDMLKRVLRYLAGTKEDALVYQKEDNSKLVGYSDADYANDAETRRSTSGYVIMWGTKPITWRCQRQSIVTLSTTEAEYISGTEMVKKLIPLKAMMEELKFIEKEPAKVYIDNKSTVNIVNNEECQERTKHIDVRVKWLNEHQDKKTIKVEHITGDQQRADILTKPLMKTKFQTNKNWLLHSLIVMMSLFTLITTSTYGYKFTKVKPVYYRTSDVVKKSSLR